MIITPEQWGAIGIRGLEVQPFGSRTIGPLDFVGSGYGIAISSGAEAQKRGYGPGWRYSLALVDVNGNPFDLSIEGDLGKNELSGDSAWDTVETFSGGSALSAYRITRDWFWPLLRLSITETAGISALSLYGWLRIHN
jgi:hypothetical protein